MIPATSSAADAMLASRCHAHGKRAPGALDADGLTSDAVLETVPKLRFALIPEVYRQPNLLPGGTGGGTVGVLTSRLSAQAASAPAGGHRPACRPVRRSDFREIAAM